MQSKPRLRLCTRPNPHCEEKFMIRLAIISDIHSNHIALDRSIEAAKEKGAAEFLFLGDYLGELAYPERTLDRIRELKKEYPCTFIRGNKEDYWIDHAAGRHADWTWENGTSGSGMLRYTFDRLSPEDIDSFAGMPIMKVMKYEGMPDFVICHGSPFKANESLREDFDYIDALTDRFETELTVCGHFHIQTQYIRNGRRIVNPGSVGIPLKSGGRTQFMMLYGENGVWTPEFLTLEYDVNAAIREMDEENLNKQAPAWYRVTKAVIKGRETSQMTVLTRAAELFKNLENGSDWRNIPEKYWDMALAEFNI